MGWNELIVCVLMYQCTCLSVNSTHIVYQSWSYQLTHHFSLKAVGGLHIIVEYNIPIYVYRLCVVSFTHNLLHIQYVLCHLLYVCIYTGCVFFYTCVNDWLLPHSFFFPPPSLSPSHSCSLPPPLPLFTRKVAWMKQFLNSHILH